jgi:hypothetical protein
VRPSPSPNSSALETEVERELWQPVPAGLDDFAAHLRKREGGAAIAAILFYGSALRARSTGEGVVDLYCLVDDLRAFYGGRRVLAAAGAILPPNVSYEVVETPEGAIRAKVAVMSAAQFRRAVRQGRGMSIWARFCQPAVLCFARDAEASVAVRSSVADAVATAARWAVRLRSEAAETPKQLWTGLFRFTYRTELRAEGPDRAGLIFDHDATRYERILGPALRASGIDYEGRGARIQPSISAVSPGRRWLELIAWSALGKTLSILRLCKAAFTFADGVDYLCWKIERHSGHRLVLTPWQRRHPLLAGPFVAWRLWRQGVLR